MEKETKEMTAEQQEIFEMVSNVCPPIVNNLLSKLNAVRKIFQSSTKVMNQINDLMTPENETIQD